MKHQEFIAELKLQTTDELLLDFCRKHVLHGIPFVFHARDDDYYEFRKRISLNFDIPFHEVYITEKIEKATGVSASNDEIKAFVSSPEPKFVQIPTGRTLYAAGNDSKRDMKWGAFQELDTDWYQQGNQLAADWYKDREMLNKIVPMFEYSVTLKEPVSAVMGYVGDQMGAPKSLVKPDSKKPLRKFQFFNPTGLGKSVRGRLLGYVVPSRKSRRK